MKEVTGTYNEALAVKCDNGTFVGHKLETGVTEYLGIPFAKPPVGDLRFRAPQKPEDSDKVFEADKFGPAPLQIERSLSEIDEDCLNLNVWVGSEVKENAPVMVWIHGGGFLVEAACDPLYTLKNLSDFAKDIVFVSLEYRLNLLGYVNLNNVPGGEDFADAQNLGVLDQIAALEWVQRNISGFGGDPSQVTIFGESAGSISVFLLMICERAKGLFHRAIAESACFNITDMEDHTLAVTENFLTATGCKTVKELQALEKEPLMEALEKTAYMDLEAGLGYYNMPVFDGRILPSSMEEAFRLMGERAGEIDLLTGSNADEVLYYAWEPTLTYDEYTELVKEALELDKSIMGPEELKLLDQFMDTEIEEEAERIKNVKYYNGREDMFRIVEFFNDYAFRAGSCLACDNHSAAGGKTYMYYMAYPPIDEGAGVMHAAELPFLMSRPYMNLAPSIANATPEEEWPVDDFYSLDVELTTVIKEMWANFARTGDPSTDKYPWPQYKEDDRNTMVFGEEIAVKKDILSKREDFLKPWIATVLLQGFRQFD
ncbi:MAG: carboxylesterase family protein [Firmicutes bacterium]|nr:carboxylesterase family protein [Bacillota bacterium]